MLLLALIALWSLLYDGVVVHAHAHADYHGAPRFVVAHIQTTNAALDDPCALCGATATLDALLLPISPDWQIAVAAAIAIPVVTRPSRAPRRRAHDWHSRAPPGSSSPR